MITGSFDDLGRPFVEARVNLPNLRIDQSVSFLLDTGADRTSLHPRDALSAGIPFDRLVNNVDSSGVGGQSSYFAEPAILSFLDHPDIRLYAIELLIADPTTTNLGFPSLLGRDIISRWYMEYDQTVGLLQFTVRGADYTLNAGA